MGLERTFGLSYYEAQKIKDLRDRNSFVAALVFNMETSLKKQTF